MKSDQTIVVETFRPIVANVCLNEKIPQLLYFRLLEY